MIIKHLWLKALDAEIFSVASGLLPLGKARTLMTKKKEMTRIRPTHRLLSGFPSSLQRKHAVTRWKNPRTPSPSSCFYSTTVSQFSTLTHTHTPEEAVRRVTHQSENECLWLHNRKIGSSWHFENINNWFPIDNAAIRVWNWQHGN